MSEILISGLLPELAAKARAFRDLCEKRGIDIIFTAGFRTPDEQMSAYAKGRHCTEAGIWLVDDPHKIVTNAMPSRAPHCRRAAFDAAPVVNERIDWHRLDLFAEMGRIGKGLGLVWGGDWPKLKDMPHFELPFWRSLPFPGPQKEVA